MLRLDNNFRIKAADETLQTTGEDPRVRAHYFLQGYFVNKGAFRGASLGALIGLPPYHNPPLLFLMSPRHGLFQPLLTHSTFTLLRYSVSKPVAKQNPPQCGSLRPALETIEAGDQDGLSASLSCSILMQLSEYWLPMHHASVLRKPDSRDRERLLRHVDAISTPHCDTRLHSLSAMAWQSLHLPF